MQDQTNPFAHHRKALIVVLAVILTTTVSGYFMGLRQTASAIARSKPGSPELPLLAPVHELSPLGVPRVVEYARLSEVDYKANAAWSNHIGMHLEKEVGAGLEAKASPADRDRVNQERASRRAFDGAPPTVPHRIDQVSAASCLACHGEGRWVKEKLATKISHAHYSNCTQCHVPSGGTELPQSALNEILTENDFLGKPAPGQGSRAYPGAPPTIPHPTWMRNDCLSCHGPMGIAGLKTSHVERQNCQQCHAPSAEMDQRAFVFRQLQEALGHSPVGGGE